MSDGTVSVSRRAYVSGRVQGVAFRWHACEEARRHGLAGWVRNLLDGRVEACYRGEPGAVEQFESWLRQGPPSAHVDSVELVDAAGQQLPDLFTID